MAPLQHAVPQLVGHQQPSLRLRNHIPEIRIKRHAPEIGACFTNPNHFELGGLSAVLIALVE